MYIVLYSLIDLKQCTCWQGNGVNDWPGSRPMSLNESQASCVETSDFKCSHAIVPTTLITIHLLGIKRIPCILLIYRFPINHMFVTCTNKCDDSFSWLHCDALSWSLCCDLSGRAICNICNLKNPTDSGYRVEMTTDFMLLLTSDETKKCCLIFCLDDHTATISQWDQWRYHNNLIVWSFTNACLPWITWAGLTNVLLKIQLWWQLPWLYPSQISPIQKTLLWLSWYGMGDQYCGNYM